MKNSITQKEVFEFKNISCNENEIIATLIKDKALSFFIEPILDVGAGSGDVSYNALHDKKVICIDTNEITDKDHLLSKNHTRQKIDFFDFVSEEQINTVFICHALQFLDDDVNMLNNKIKELNPRRVITVTNNNDDILGEIVRWTEENYTQGNPEVHIDFPINYTNIESFPFQTEVTCNDFSELAKQVSYLMLIDNQDTTAKLQVFLENRLSLPKFSFSQSLNIYDLDK